MVIGFDASALIACVSSWHPRHAATNRLVADRLARGDELVVAAHALVELHATLTRLPAEHRRSAAEVVSIVQANTPRPWRVVTLDARTVLDLLVRCAGRTPATLGGRTYDALIAATVASAGAREIVTLNPRHFQGLDPSLGVVEPED